MDNITADRISDRIVDVLNSELAIMKRDGSVNGVALLVGLCLAYKAIEKTMPYQGPRPAVLVDLGKAVDNFLFAILDHLPEPNL